VNTAATVLVTGVAGFIGRAVAERLLGRGNRVIGIDDLSGRSDARLQTARLMTLAHLPGFTLIHRDMCEPGVVAALMLEHGVQNAVHLAARTGVRQSADRPFAYQQANIAGHLIMLDACQATPGFAHFVYASSSSVYGERALDGGSAREDDATDRPTSIYAATKRAGELLSESFAHVHGLPQTGLRLFTAYGPWGRPDMSYFRFTKAMMADVPIKVFGDGLMARDFTYIDDIVDGIVAVLDRPPARGENRLLNLGSGQPVALPTMIAYLEAAMGFEAQKRHLARQPGDVTATHADITALTALTGFQPRTTLAGGLEQFVAWYRDFYPNA
jgi:UDP-glucuronate 4-epimerase